MIPIKTDLTLRRVPYANYVLIAINIVIFILSYAPHPVQYGVKVVQEPLSEWTHIFILNSARPQTWQFLTYAFLHSGYQHIIGNLFFLYLFGNNVNDRLGNTGYISFYFAGCIFSGVGYTLLHDTPVIGASGAVSAVTGAYLVLYPRSVITVLYWFVIIGTIDVPAIWFILLKMVIIDNILQARYMSAPIAYDAHLSGYAFGILTVFILLCTNLLTRSKFDMFGLLNQTYRRRRYAAVVRDLGLTEQGIDIHKVAVDAALPEKEKINTIYRLRSEISENLIKKKLSEAREGYFELMALDGKQVLPLREQLDISNFLMACGNYKEAAEAYLGFIDTYEEYEYIEQIFLMLGIIYSRYLQDKLLAKKYLELAKEGLENQDQKKMCQSELNKLSCE